MIVALDGARRLGCGGLGWSGFRRGHCWPVPTRDGIVGIFHNLSWYRATYRIAVQF
jgi:hypothetical protein